MAKAKKFLQSAIKKPGQLHKDLGIPMGQHIPLSIEESAAKRPGKVGARARLALAMRKMKHGGRKK